MVQKFYLLFLRKILVKLYRVYLFFSRKFQRFRPKQGNTFFHLFTKKNFAHVVLVFGAVLMATGNIQASAAARDEEFFDSLLYLMIEREEFGYLIEQKVDLSSDGVVTNYLSTGALSKNTSPLTREADTEGPVSEDVNLTHGGTAVIKPNISDMEVNVKNRSVDIAYVVEAGDTISTIAERYGIAQNTILWANSLTSSSYIKPNQKLVIPPSDGIYHNVKKGETIGAISAKYDVASSAIVTYNELASAESLSIGQRLFIPEGRPVQPAPVPSTWKKVKEIFTPDKTPSVATGTYIWPTECRRITQYSGWRHTAVDIACPLGTPIYASRSGVVAQAETSGWNSGYGLVIVIDHEDGTQTLYGHNSQIYVTVGQRVTQGEVISAMGSTGKSTGPHVHFEVRKGGTRQNPLSFIR